MMPRELGGKCLVTIRKLGQTEEMADQEPVPPKLLFVRDFWGRHCALSVTLAQSISLIKF
jgi:hypothetical protein